MDIFVAIYSWAILAKKVKMAIMAIMARLDMATNMPIIGVFGKNRKNVDHLRKRN